MKDIRDLKEYKSFYMWELNTSILHFKTENIQRNLEIFDKCLANIQGISKSNMTKLAIDYDVTKERVRQLYNKYLIHFILYLVYILEYEEDNKLVTNCIDKLSKRDGERVQQHFKDGNPFKHITSRELFIFRYTNVTKNIMTK